MSEHYNLYYLFREDKQKNQMPEAMAKEILKNIEKFYKKIKPLWNERPPNNIKT